MLGGWLHEPRDDGTTQMQRVLLILDCILHGVRYTVYAENLNRDARRLMTASSPAIDDDLPRLRPRPGASCNCHASRWTQLPLHPRISKRN